MKTIVVVISVLLTFGTFVYASPISQQWIRTYGGPEDDSFNCIQQTMDGGYVATGPTRSFAPGLSIQLWVLKFDVNGNISWQKTYPYGTWLNDAYAIQQVSDGGYIVAGFNGNIGPGAGWILKLDGNGDIIWQKAFIDLTQFTSIQQTTDGGYVALGEYPPNEVVVTKLDSSGNVTWAKSYILGSHAGGHQVLQTNDGGYIFTMDAYLANGYTPCILKLDSNGDIIWQKSYNKNGSVNSIHQTSDGG